MPGAVVSDLSANRAQETYRNFLWYHFVIVAGGRGSWRHAILFVERRRREVLLGILLVLAVGRKEICDVDFEAVNDCDYLDDDCNACNGQNPAPEVHNGVLMVDVAGASESIRNPGDD